MIAVSGEGLCREIVCSIIVDLLGAVSNLRGHNGIKRVIICNTVAVDLHNLRQYCFPDPTVDGVYHINIDFNPLDFYSYELTNSV